MMWMRRDECVDWDGDGCVFPFTLLLFCVCLSDLNEGEWGL